MKIKILILSFILISLVTLAFLLSFLSPDTKPTPKPPVLAPTEIPIAYPTTPTSALKISLLSPLSNELDKLSIASPIILSFSSPINPDTLKYEIIPAIDVITSLDSSAKNLTFIPNPFWSPNTPYTLVIKGVMGQDGSGLLNEYKLQFKALVAINDD